MAVAITSILLASACGSAGGGGTANAGGAANGSSEPHRTAFDPKNFVDPTLSTNKWHPLRPGMHWVRVGTTEVGSRAVPHQVVTTMTDVTRVIDGVKTIAMIDQDTDAGQLTQASIDYFGLDKFGNVWILGGYTEDYEGGVFTNSVDAFLGLKGGRAVGILMPANPVLATPRWFIGQTAHEDGSAAEVVEQHSHQCVPFACYDNVLVVREGEVKAIDNEFKFYAPGVGQIMNSPRKDSKHKDTERLANFTQLSRKGLDEIARVVLNLEAHARQTEPKIFGSASMARRFP